MGDSERGWPELASGLSAEGAHSFRAAFDAFQDKGEEWWATAELRVAELITAIQPNPASEVRRQAVVEYITKLIQSCVNCQVVRFGSVPLKTYLPDGDIDLTVVSPNVDSKRTWIDDVHNVLQKEIDNPKAEFRVTQVQLVSAEVKLLKVYVEKLLVDVSFDQLGGVCTLCFLEEVDRLIGEDHLFKRSIILVKAWCYYESRLLGADCNLMSTYALETLVLYIFHLFHASLWGPLQVLYLFLEFFSSFDWDKYCVSLSGPILLTSFSEETERQSVMGEDFQRLVLSSRREGGELLFTKAFLDACERTYGLVRVNHVAKPTKFPVKSLNIIDPLRSTNNLGRSVNQGNCARIRRAFVRGARRLRGILHGSETDVCAELDEFFKDIRARYYGSSHRPDVTGPSARQGNRIPNSLQRMGGGRRSDTASSERNEESVANARVSENGDHPPQARPFNNVLRVDPRDLTARDKIQLSYMNGVKYQGVGVVSPPFRSKNSNESAGSLTSGGGAEPTALSLRDTKIDSNGSNGDVMAHDARHNDEESIRGDDPPSRRVPCEPCSLQIVCDELPVGSSAHGENELSSGMFSERTRSGDITMEGLESLVHKMGRTGLSKQLTAVSGSEPSLSGSTSPRSKNESEEEEESSSQSSSSKENFESGIHGASSELQGRPPDPQRSALDVAGVEAEVQAPSTSDEPSKNLRVEEERESSVPLGDSMQTANNPGLEIPGVAESSPSRAAVRKGRIHQPNGTPHSSDLGSGLGQAKRKRGPGKDKGYGRAAQDGGPFSSSSGTALHPQQSSVGTSVYHPPPRHSPTDFAAAGSHFKTSPFRPYSNASGPGSFRHPLANYQFDPGTTRMTSGHSSAASHSSDPQHMPSYYPVPFPPGFSPPSSMYSPGRNSFHKRNSTSRGDGSVVVPATSRPDQESVEALSNDHSVESPGLKSQSKVSEKVTPPVAVGIVERLEADGIAASTSSRRSQPAAATRTSTHGAGVPSGNSTSEFLTGDLKLQLELLAYGRFCEDCCNPSPLQYSVGYPAYGSEQHAHRHVSWEGPGRPAQVMAHSGLYAPGPGWLPLYQQQAGYYPQLQPYWGPRGVELSPRPRGTGTYLPNSQLRQNIKAPSGRGRGGGQNGSQHQDSDKYHHQSREHENSHRFHGPHHRASVSKEEAHAQGAVHGTAASTRSTVRAEKARDFHHPKHEFARASHPCPASPSVSSPRAIVPEEMPQPRELLLRGTTDTDWVSGPVAVRKPARDDSSGAASLELHPGSVEHDVASAPLPVSELPFSEEAEAILLGGGMKSGPQLKRSASVGHAFDQSVECEGAGVISGLTNAVGDGKPTATTPTQRDGRQTYHMKEEDFPPLGGRRVGRGEVVATGVPSSSSGTLTSHGIGRFISL